MSSDPARSRPRRAVSSAAFILKLRPGQPARPRRESARIGKAGRCGRDFGDHVEQAAGDHARLGLVDLLQDDEGVDLRGDRPQAGGEPLHKRFGRGRPVLGVEPVELDGRLARLDHERFAVGEGAAVGVVRK